MHALLQIELLKIMYAPLDYIHPARLPAQGPYSMAMRRWLNHSLIKRYDLPVSVDRDVVKDEISQLVVHNWFFLSEALWLLGCKLLSATLAENGQLTTLSKKAAHFLALPIPCPKLMLTDKSVTPSITPTLSDARITAFGVHALLAGLPDLPSVLAARIPLLFAPEPVRADISVINLTFTAQELTVRTLLTFGLDYAKTNLH